MTAHLTPVPNPIPSTGLKPDAIQAPPPTAPTRPAPSNRRVGSVQREEFEHMVSFVREGHDLAKVVSLSGRSQPTVTKYLRQMLPLEERACPDALLAERLRQHLDQEDYDWKATMLLTPPPPPIQRIERAGLPGLADAELVTLLLALAERIGPRDRAMFEVLKREIQQRHLRHQVCDARRRELVRAGLDTEQATRAASVWVSDHFGLDDGYDRFGRYSQDPWRTYDPEPYDIR